MVHPLRLGFVFGVLALGAACSPGVRWTCR